MNCFELNISFQIALAQVWMIWSVSEWVRMQSDEGGVTWSMNGAIGKVI